MTDDDTEPTMIVRTQNSVYEINMEDKLIRRVRGVRRPTPHQGRDGEWRRYQNLDPYPELGRRFWIWWTVRPDGTAKITLTSAVESIEEVSA